MCITNSNTLLPVDTVTYFRLNMLKNLNMKLFKIKKKFKINNTDLQKKKKKRKPYCLKFLY